MLAESQIFVNIVSDIAPKTERGKCLDKSGYFIAVFHTSTVFICSETCFFLVVFRPVLKITPLKGVRNILAIFLGFRGFSLNRGYETFFDWPCRGTKHIAIPPKGYETFLKFRRECTRPGMQGK